MSLSPGLGRLLLGSLGTVLRARISRPVQCWPILCIQRDQPSDRVQLLQEPRVLCTESNLRGGGHKGALHCNPGRRGRPADKRARLRLRSPPRPALVAPHAGLLSPLWPGPMQARGAVQAGPSEQAAHLPRLGQLLLLKPPQRL